MSSMVKCLLCGREFKNEAGLSGHMRMVHPTAVSVDGHEVEARLMALEVVVNELVQITKATADTLVTITKAMKGV